jgi:hypothetical protein
MSPSITPPAAFGDSTYDGDFVPGPSGGAHYVTTQADDSLDNEHLLSDMIGRGLISARPAPGIAGRLYYSTDANTLERDNGSAWQTVEGVAATQLDRSSILVNGVGYKFWAFDPSDLTTNQGLVQSQAHFSLCPIPIGTVVTNLHIFVKTPGVALSLAKMGLYTKGGIQLAESASVTTQFESAGRATVPLITPYTIPTSDVYYAAVLCVGSTMPVVFRGFSDTLSPFAEVGSGARRYAIQNLISDLPTTASLTTDTQAIWMGGS